MAIARIEPYARQYTPLSLRSARPARRTRLVPPVRAAAIVTILGGWYLQHALVNMPLEALPTPLAVPATHTVQPESKSITLHQDQHSQPRASTRLQPHPILPVATTPHHRQVLALAATARRPTIVLPPVGSFGDAARRAVAPNPLGLIMHASSVSVTAIRAALQGAGSPALYASYADHKDVAEYMWDSGRVLGVDPAVVMAIFHHESVYGTRGMAVMTHSVGNIRPLPGQPSLDGYRYYATWQEGIDDCFRLLLSYARHGATTIPLAIPVWAPPSDNNDDGAYIASVLGTMGSLYASSMRG